MQFYKSPRAISVQVTRVKATEPGKNSGRTPVELSISYRNYTKVPVTCILRNGYGFQVPPESRVGKGEFIVSVTYSIWHGVKTDVHHVLNDVDDKSSFELKAIAAAISTGDKSYDKQRTVFKVEFSVTLDELRDGGGSLYLRELDLLTSILETSHVPQHPYDQRTLTRNLAETNPGINDTDVFGYYLRIVDNQSVFGDHYLNLNGEVFAVPAVIDMSMESGVYLVSSHPIRGNQPLPPPRFKRIDFDEAIKTLNLFRTYAEAESLGDVFGEKERAIKESNAAKEQELKEMIHRHKQDEHEMKLEKLRRDSELDERKLVFDERKRTWEENKAEIDEDRRRRQEELKLREMELAERMFKFKAEREEWDHHRHIESMRKKDYYEDKSYRRRDYGELFKYIPMFTTAVATLYVAYLKAKKQ